MIATYNYQCTDPTNGKLEWPNWNEIDYTPDNSHLTSVVTDGILATEPDDALDDLLLGNPNAVRDSSVNSFVTSKVGDEEEVEVENSPDS